MTRQELPSIKNLMAVLNYAAMEEHCVFEPMAAESAYERKTTFFSDFSIAECEGVAAIKDTFEKATESWRKDIVYMTELVMSLNWKCWEWWEREDKEFAMLYSELYRKADKMVFDVFEEDKKAIHYYLETTD